MSPDTPAAEDDLSDTLWSQRDFKGARKLQEQTLETLRRISGEQHPDTLEAMRNLAAILCSQGDYEGAHELALTLLERDDCDGARNLLERILDARQATLGNEHPRSLETMSDLSITLLYLGESDYARMVRDRLLEVSRSSKATKVNWRLAERVATRITDRRAPKDTTAWPVSLSVVELAQKIAAYTGIECPSELPRLEIVDHAAWSADRHAIERLGSISRNQAFYSPSRRGASGRVADRLRSTARDLRGIAEGVRTGLLAGETIAHYQCFQEDPTAARLVLVSPNIAAWVKSQEEWDELVLWIIIHELTHLFQLQGVSWVPAYAEAIRSDLQGQILQARPGDQRDYAAAFKRLGSEFASELFSRRLGAPTTRFDLFLTLIEGHADHVADALATEMISGLPAARMRQLEQREDPAQRRLRARVREHIGEWRGSARQAWYIAGLRFCDLVAQRAGPEGLSNLWREPAALPTATELEDPQLWLARI